MQNPYSPPPKSGASVARASPARSRRSVAFLVSVVVIFTTVFSGTLFAFAGGIQQWPWELSPANVRFGSRIALVLGAVNSLVAGAISQIKTRIPYSVTIAVWIAVIGGQLFALFVWVAAIASC